MGEMLVHRRDLSSQYPKLSRERRDEVSRIELPCDGINHRNEPLCYQLINTTVSLNSAGSHYQKRKKKEKQV